MDDLIEIFKEIKDKCEPMQSIGVLFAIDYGEDDLTIEKILYENKEQAGVGDAQITSIILSRLNENKDKSPNQIIIGREVFLKLYEENQKPKKPEDLQNKYEKDCDLSVFKSLTIEVLEVETGHKFRSIIPYKYGDKGEAIFCDNDPDWEFDDGPMSLFRQISNHAIFDSLGDSNYN